MDPCTPRDSDGLRSLSRPTDDARQALRVAGVLLGALAVAVAVAVGIAVALTRPDGSAYPELVGLVAGGVTLLACRVLQRLGAGWWDRHLHQLDLQNWAVDWARVGPTWSRLH